jgi:uncharacterized protein (TIGR02145 family)
LFKQMPGVSGGSQVASPSVVGGISGLQKAAAYEADDEKRYLVNLSTEPAGVALSFDGVPSCPKTPCKVELREGNVRIIAALEQYETTDTTVSIKQNNQNITIALKPNFGILEIKSAYSDGIGSDKQWDLSINGKPNFLGEIRLSPNKYSVKLNHECYENIGFDVGINKGKREVFDMANKITLKKGGLALSAERDGEPVSEPVYVNGKKVGETPFNGAVPLCAMVEIGSGREAVDVKLKYNEKVKHTHSIYVDKNSFTDNRDGKKYRTVVIGDQTWMAENLNYNASGSICNDNKPANCDKYGRLYDWNTAKTACPKGWHLPNREEWRILITYTRSYLEGIKLKATSGWNDNKGKSGNGTDDFGFSALPGGGSGPRLRGKVGDYGCWWSGSKYQATNDAFFLYISNGDRNTISNDYSNKDSSLLSIRCVKD